MRAGTARASWLWLHRWLGLALLACWLLLGATGSVLVLYRELLNHVQLDGRALASGPLDPDRALQSLHAWAPERQGPWRIEWPLSPGEPAVARYMRPAEHVGPAFAPLMVWLQPDGSAVLGQQLWGRELLTWLYDLHYSLLLDLPGRQVVGALGALWCISWLSGLLLWWPRPGQWRAAWRMKWHAGGPRRVYDLHKGMGLAFAVVALVLGVTGMVLTWHQPIERALAAWVPVFQPPRLAAAAPPLAKTDGNAQPALGLRALVARAQAPWPHAQPRWLEVSPAGWVRVQLWQPGEPSRRFPRTQVWLDQRTGHTLAVRDGLRDQPADAVLAWMHPLHNGEALGWPGRAWVLLCGLAPWGLGLTGWWRWRHKRRVQQALRRRVVPSATAICQEGA